MRVSRRVGAASLFLGLCGMFAAAQDPKPAQAPEAVRPVVEAIDDEALLARIEQACEAQGSSVLPFGLGVDLQRDGDVTHAVAQAMKPDL